MKIYNEESNNSSSSKELRRFYEDLYQSNQSRNPALEIYDRLRIETIQSLSNNIQGTILIAGCGSNLDNELFIDQGKSFFFDFSYFAVKTAFHKSRNVFTADALHIPLPNKSFDLIVCSEVLEHIPQIQIVISEFSRLLKPSGILIISSPNWISLFGAARFFGEKMLRRPLHSSDQPYDDWKSYWKYKKQLSSFHIAAVRGIWYLPPLHYKENGISDKWMKRLFFLFKPFEKLYSRVFPLFGHLIILKLTPSRTSDE